jgi:hypothetical protein
MLWVACGYRLGQHAYSPIQVAEGGLWGDVTRHLGFIVDNSDAVERVKAAYRELLLPYENAYVAHHLGVLWV